MSKPYIEAFEKVEKAPTFGGCCIHAAFPNECNMIEAALECLGLEHDLRIYIENDNHKLIIENEQNQKKLKAFEIIKNCAEVIEDAAGYRIRITCDSLFKEEFDILKEALYGNKG